MTIPRIELSIAAEFTVTPGPRKRAEGEFSGEEFLEAVLRPRFVSALDTHSMLSVNLDGAAGYPTSFLEEAFGGLAREFGAEQVQSSLEVTCEDEPYLGDDIKRYIREASGKK